jgi:hypothetical protein
MAIGMILLGAFALLSAGGVYYINSKGYEPTPIQSPTDTVDNIINPNISETTGTNITSNITSNETINTINNSTGYNKDYYNFMMDSSNPILQNLGNMFYNIEVSLIERLHLYNFNPEHILFMGCTILMFGIIIYWFLTNLSNKVTSVSSILLLLLIATLIFVIVTYGGNI